MKCRLSALQAMFVMMLCAVALSAAGHEAFAETTKDRVFREGKIVVGIHNRAPWGYRDEATGEVAGWHPDLLRAAFADLGVDEIDIRVTEFGALIPGLLAGRFDVVASGLSITPERCQQVAFSKPDLRELDAALVLPGNPKSIHGYEDIVKNPAIIMGAGRGSVVVRNALEVGVPSERMLLFPDIQSNVAALRTGRVDVVLLSLPTVRELLQDGTARDIEQADPFVIDDAIANYGGIAFRKEDDDLRALYDERFIALKKAGTFAEIMAKYGFEEAQVVPDTITTEQICNDNFGGAE